GTVPTRSGVRVAILEQTTAFDSGLTVGDVLAAGHDLAPDAAEKAVRLATQMGVTDLGAMVDTLSGGQRKRLALARLMASEPDVLLLDEPTNHLDIATIEWLERTLGRSRMTLLMVTHDRYFLDRVCNRIIEIDREQIFSYPGNYENYLRRRAERINAMSQELAKVKNTLRREQEWMNRQPQARAGKAQYRIDAFHDLKRRSQVDLTERNVSLGVASSYIGSKIFEADGICKSYGDKKILDGFSYVFARGEKVGIVGPNGVGKSTFIKMLQGLEPSDSGVWDVGQTVRFGYYSQEGISLDPGKRVIDAVTDLAEDIVVNDGVHFSPMQFLQHFLFSPKDQQKYIEKLSGGERARLHLATVLMRSPNFLILDEPTNDLDIVTLGILEDYLQKFTGCLIVVSHDRFFLDSIVDHLFVFEGDGVVRDFPGNYTDYRKWADMQQKPQEVAATQKGRRPERERRERLSFKERREFEALETELEALNAEKAELEALFASGVPVDGIEEKSARFSELATIIDEKEMRWLELSEKA
ncbi:MAG: ABC-F family ATP-binding cassette domain-containing protein, partial [Muribaculaceae bacterium]|nr:ABC-F family ATP-binding cassette domain-containing protein [Muribaculaceae bacterium]